MLLDHCYVFGLLLQPSGLKKKILEEGAPRDIFTPRPGSAFGPIWQKNNNTCKGPWVLHPYRVSSKSIKRFWRRSWKCERLRTTDGRRRRTDNGQCAMKIAHLSLWLNWAKKWIIAYIWKFQKWSLFRTSLLNMEQVFPFPNVIES